MDGIFFEAGPGHAAPAGGDVVGSATSLAIAQILGAGQAVITHEVGAHAHFCDTVVLVGAIVAIVAQPLLHLVPATDHGVADIRGARVAVITQKPQDARDADTLDAHILETAGVAIGAGQPLAVVQHLAFSGTGITDVLQTDLIGLRGTDRHGIGGEEALLVLAAKPPAIAEVFVVKEGAIGILLAGDGEHGVGHAEPFIAVPVKPVRAHRALPLDRGMEAPLLRIAIVGGAGIAVVAGIYVQRVSGAFSRLASVVRSAQVRIIAKLLLQVYQETAFIEIALAAPAGRLARAEV